MKSKQTVLSLLVPALLAGSPAAQDQVPISSPTSHKAKLHRACQAISALDSLEFTVKVATSMRMRGQQRALQSFEARGAIRDQVLHCVLDKHEEILIHGAHPELRGGARTMLESLAAGVLAMAGACQAQLPDYPDSRPPR